MVFDKLIGINPEQINQRNARHAVKGVCVDGEKILLMKSNRGDYTFPGGGVEAGESHQEAIMREIKEETGYSCREVGKNIGCVQVRRRDLFDRDKMYESIMHFYMIKVSTEREEQKLTSSEAKWSLEPLWMDIDEAIALNKKYLEGGTRAEFWMHPEIFVLEHLRDNRE